MKITESYVLPEYYAGYLVNDDPSGLTDEEITEIDNFLDDNKLGSCLDCSCEPYFKHGHDMNREQGANVLEYKFIQL